MCSIVSLIDDTYLWYTASNFWDINMFPCDRLPLQDGLLTRTWIQLLAFIPKQATHIGSKISMGQDSAYSTEPSLVILWIYHKPSRSWIKERIHELSKYPCIDEAGESPQYIADYHPWDVSTCSVNSVISGKIEIHLTYKIEWYNSEWYQHLGLFLPAGFGYHSHY